MDSNTVLRQEIDYLQARAWKAGSWGFGAAFLAALIASVGLFAGFFVFTAFCLGAMSALAGATFAYLLMNQQRVDRLRRQIQ